MPPKPHHTWLELDTAAILYPAVRKRNWNAAFRVACVLEKPVQPELLQQAVDALYDRFPSFYAQ